MFQRKFQVLRLIHRTCPQMVKKKPTPVAGHQLEALENAQEYINDPEAFGDFESDFMHVNKSHRQHEAEIEVQREQVRHMVVKRKYFKEPQLPNLLLFAEKEEIRSLYASDAEEWTIEKLAESFPATQETIKKIVESKWRPYSLKRIRTHDEAVIKNWERLKSGIPDDMFIPADLREHVAKFAKRTFKNTATGESVNLKLEPKLPPPTGNEFSQIITSCKKYAEKDEKTQETVTLKTQQNLKPNIDPSDETYLIDKVRDKRKMRLQELQEIYGLKVFDKKNEATKTPENKDEQILVSHYENPIGTGFARKFESNEIVVSAEDSKKYEITPYKDQIHIPRKLWRKGGTYRVEDCYYDDDGEFLYRVPGMSGVK